MAISLRFAASTFLIGLRFFVLGLRRDAIQQIIRIHPMIIPRRTVARILHCFTPLALDSVHFLNLSKQIFKAWKCRQRYSPAARTAEHSSTAVIASALASKVWAWPSYCTAHPVGCRNPEVRRERRAAQSQSFAWREDSAVPRALDRSTCICPAR